MHNNYYNTRSRNIIIKHARRKRKPATRINLLKVIEIFAARTIARVMVLTPVTFFAK